MDYKTENSLKPGDHIASRRKLGTYEHHGIYIGQDANGVHKVIHFKGPIKDSWINCSMQSKVPDCKVCDFKPPKKGGKVSVTTCLECFRNRSSVYVIKYKTREPLKYSEYNADVKPGKVLHGYRTDELYQELYMGDKLIGYAELPSHYNKEFAESHVVLSEFISRKSPEEVIEAARSNHYQGKYQFMFNNCEDFAVYCMTDKERSSQAKNMLHNVPYKIGKTVHLLTDGRKMKEKCKEKIDKGLDKALRFLDGTS